MADVYISLTPMTIICEKKTVTMAREDSQIVAKPWYLGGNGEFLFGLERNYLP